MRGVKCETFEMNRIKTPQFRVEPTKRVKNAFPGCVPEFIDAAGPGLSFRLKDERGRYRSPVVRFHRYHEGLLSRQALRRYVLGFKAGLPKFKS